MKLSDLIAEFKQDYAIGAEINADRAHLKIKTMCRQATETMNRKIGQGARYHLARIEKAKREFGAGK